MSRWQARHLVCCCSGPMPVQFSGQYWYYSFFFLYICRFRCSCGWAVVWLHFLPQQNQTLRSLGLLVYLEQLFVLLLLSCFHIPFSVLCPVIMCEPFYSVSSCRPCMTSAMRGCAMACISLKNEEEGAVPLRNTSLMISLFRALSKGVLLMPLTRRIWLICTLMSCLVCILYLS